MNIEEKLEDILDSLDYFNYHNKNLTKTQYIQLLSIEDKVKKLKESLKENGK